MDVPITATAIPGRQEQEALRFLELVRAEARRTWSGRFRWLWRAAGIPAVAIAAVVASPGFDSWAFILFCGLACWVPAWLGADLLAIRFPENEDPLREWAPWEFAARAAGRLGPFLAAQCAWLLVFTGRAIADRILLSPASRMIDPLHGASWVSLPAWAVAWTIVFAASGLPYFAAAATMSAMARRPRRLAVVLPVVLVGGTLLLLATSQLPGASRSPATSGLSSALSDPVPLLSLAGGMGNLWIGLFSAGGVAELVKYFGTELPNSFAALCWVATGCFAIYALPLWSITWWVAARRYRAWRGHGKPDRPKIDFAKGEAGGGT